MKKEELLKAGLSKEQAEIIMEMNEKDKSALRFEMGVQSALLKHGARNFKTVLPLIEFGEKKEENLPDVEKQIEKLKNSEETAFLFKSEEKKVRGAKIEKGIDAARDKGMTYTQMCKNNF